MIDELKNDADEFLRLGKLKVVAAVNVFRDPFDSAVFKHHILDL